MFLSISLIYYIALFIATMYSIPYYNDEKPLTPLVLSLYYFYVENTYITVSACTCLGLIGVTGYLLYLQMCNVLANTTTYEKVSWRRYSLLKSPSDENKRINPFNLGSWKANLKEFVLGGRNWYSFYWNELLPDNTNTYEIGAKIINHEDFEDEAMKDIATTVNANVGNNHGHNHNHNHNNQVQISVV